MKGVVYNEQKNSHPIIYKIIKVHYNELIVSLWKEIPLMKEMGL